MEYPSIYIQSIVFKHNDKFDNIMVLTRHNDNASYQNIIDFTNYISILSKLLRECSLLSNL